MATDWTAIRTEYVNGADYPALAKKYKVKEGTLRVYASRHQWPQERSKVQQNVTKKVTAALVKVSVQTLTEFHNGIVTLASKILARVDAQMDIPDLSPADLRALGGTAESAVRIGRLALGADDVKDSDKEGTDTIVGFKIVPYSTPD